MRYLFQAWAEVEPLLREVPLMVFLDYDGTLTPIVEHPRLAKLPSEGKRVLRAFLKTPGVQVAIVSGRSLGEVKRQVGLEKVIYVGNHGLELEGPKVRFAHPGAAEARRDLQKIAGGLRRLLRPYRGLFVENKSLTLSVHYRKLSPERVAGARQALLKALRPALRNERVVLTEGKKVWEIRPPFRWHKGTAVLWLLARAMAHSDRKMLSVYVGDDQTDEDAFRAMGQKGLGIRVGEGGDEPTAARYYVRSPKEVYDFLKRLQRLREGKERS